jgi:hypothetical protein
MAHVEEPPPAVTTAAPLEAPTNVPALPNNNASSSGGAKPTTPTAKPTPTPVPTPVPTPTPQKPDPPECKRYRDAKAGGRPAATLKALETQCRNAGGTP